MRFARLLLLLSSMSALGSAQMELNTPRSGFVLDTRAASLRPILGFPGAAVLGNSLSLPWALQKAVIRGGPGIALAITNASEQEAAKLVLIRRMNESSPQSITLPQAAPQRMALNETGNAAVLYYSETAEFRFVSKLDADPSESGLMQSAAVPGKVLALAVSANGKCALVGSQSDTTGYVHELCADKSQARQLLSREGMDVSALVYAKSGKDALVADRSGNRVFQIRGIDALPQPREIATEADGIAQPEALQAVSDKEAIVANGGSQLLFSLDLDKGTLITQLEAPSTVTELDYLSASDVLLGRQPGSLSVILIDLQRNRQVFFVPVPAEGQN